MVKNATLCFALGLFLFGEGACNADDTVPDTAKVGNEIRLTRVELFPAGQGVFEYESTETGEVELTLPLTRHELDDLLKSLVLKGFDSARVDYEPNADRNNAERNSIVSQVLSSENSMTRAELLQGLKGHAIQLTDESSSMSGVIVAVELQSHERIAGQEVEVITLRTAEGIEQHVLSAATRITFADKSVQAQLDQALANLAKPATTRTPTTLKLKKKVPGPAGIAFQTETAAWKCSYRIAKIDGEYQLVVAAVIDNTSVRIQLPKVTIRAGASESVFLPSIPRIIDDVRVYVASVSKKHPLSAFQITLQNGYQLPGGPGTVWSDSGYAGDIMFPRLVAQVPQLVTYALDTSVEITSEILPEHASKATYRFDGEGTLIGTKISQRHVRYSLSNDSKSAQTVWIEHQPAERNWLPAPVGDQVGKADLTSFRYKVDVPSKSTAKKDILETETIITKWPKGTNWVLFKYLTEAAGMTPEIRDRLETRIRRLAEYEVLKATETKLTSSKENAAIEQRRIKELMIALNREDELHKRYLTKLATLESEIESSAGRIVTVRKELEDSKTRLGQE